jgi:hypothetical protein
MAAHIIYRDGKWRGMDDNNFQKVSSNDIERVRRVMAQYGFTNVPVMEQAGDDAVAAAPVAEDISRDWPVNQRFGFVTQLVTMVARGLATSAVITGPGGLGKTHTVRAALQAAGLDDASSFESDRGYGSYRMIKGHSTAKGLYRELYLNRSSVTVFDDCDSIQKDAVSLNLLKGALDSYDKRIINWNADLKDDDLPRSFQFDGRVIFISNMRREQLDPALLTRAYCVDLSMTTEQKLERMQVLVNSAEFLPQFGQQHKQESMELISQVGNRCKELSLRTLQAVTRIRAADTANWRDMAEYVLTN